MPEAAEMDCAPFGGAPRGRAVAERAMRDERRKELRKALRAARRKALKPPPSLTVDQWADRYRVLSREASSTGGKWDTARVEAARGFMRAVTEPGVRSIAVMACTQLLKTELLNNICGYFMHLDPCPIILMQPTEGMAETWSKDRLAPMLRDSPALRELVRSKGRSSDSTILHKTFPGGHVTMIGANSPTELASRPVRIVLADEVDKYPASSGSEGDPISLLLERTATFPSSYLLVMVCSPTVKGASRIEKGWLEGDQRRGYVPCPHCGHRQAMLWGDRNSRGGVRWSLDDNGELVADSVAYHCTGCGCAWTEAERLGAVAQVDYRQTRPFTCCGTAHEPMADHEADPEAQVWEWNGWVWRARCRTCGRHAVPNEAVSGHLNKLYSPWEPLAKLVRKFLAAKDDPQRLKVFVNTQLAEVWEEQGEKLEGGELLARREVYAAEIPDGVAQLVAGVDVQDNRLECTLLGLGRDNEMWVVDHAVFPGDTNEVEVWRELDDYLLRIRHSQDGTPYAIQAAAVDSGGHRTAQVYQWCMERKGRRILAIKGDNRESRGPTKPRQVWPSTAKITRGRFPYYDISTNSAKFYLRSALSVSRPGPRYVHIPTTLDESYIAQLTVERVITRTRGGVSWQIWDCPDGKRNEAWDCLVYAYAAWCYLVGQGAKVNVLADRLAARAGRAPSAAPATPPAEAARAAPKAPAIVGSTDLQPTIEPAAEPPAPPPAPVVDRPKPKQPGAKSWLGSPRKSWF